jgi:hypothetical protein
MHIIAHYCTKTFKNKPKNMYYCFLLQKIFSTLAVMRLTDEKRARIVSIYIESNLCFEMNKYKLLKLIAASENKIASSKTMRKVISKWQKTGK